jgi:hypothetical protein
MERRANKGTSKPKRTRRTKYPTARELEESNTETWSLKTSDGTEIAAYDYCGGYYKMRYGGKWCAIKAPKSLVLAYQPKNPEHWKIINKLFNRFDFNRTNKDHRIFKKAHKEQIFNNDTSPYVILSDPIEQREAIIDLHDAMRTVVKDMHSSLPMVCLIANKHFHYTYREIAKHLNITHTTARKMALRAEAKLTDVRIREERIEARRK